MAISRISPGDDVVVVVVDIGKAGCGVLKPVEVAGEKAWHQQHDLSVITIIQKLSDISANT